MSRAGQLAKHVERTVTGPMWHGPALAEVLTGVTHEQAAARPIANAHSIWELVLHVTAWSDLARARLKGQSIGDPAPEQDWPPAPAAGTSSAAKWIQATEQLGASHRLLAADVRELDDARLDMKIDGLEYSAGTLVHGVIEHGTYHGGQIILLKKAKTGAGDEAIPA
jgi:uncharacterized damage-inducible protein DinB